MATQNRRQFLKTVGMVGGALAGTKPNQSEAAPVHFLSENRSGVLVDTTVCIGCRKCEYACKVAHNIPTPTLDSYEDRAVFKNRRRTTDETLTVVNEYVNDKNVAIPINVKTQCMHCDYPACVSACIVGALDKFENGSVIWDGNKCIGCRYCMVACPFQIPAFEYSKAIQPEIRKCDFCAERTAADSLPACVEICPVEALSFGKRSELLAIARERISSNPSRYYNHIYGETEVGGTDWLYLSAKPMEELGLPVLGHSPAPGVSESIQHGIFAYFVPPLSLYALLGGVMWLNKNKKEEE